MICAALIFSWHVKYRDYLLIDYGIGDLCGYYIFTAFILFISLHDCFSLIYSAPLMLSTAFSFLMLGETVRSTLFEWERVTEAQGS